MLIKDIDNTIEMIDKIIENETNNGMEAWKLEVDMSPISTNPIKLSGLKNILLMFKECVEEDKLVYFNVLPDVEEVDKRRIK